MKFLKNKQVWQILAIIVIMAVAIILLFVPELIDHKYPYSYDKIKKQNDKIVSINSNLISNESNIQNSIYSLEAIELELETVDEDVFQIRKGIRESDFEMHIPSILISLEQAALKNNLKLTIDYNSMTTTTNQAVPVLPPTNDSPTKQEPGEDKDDKNVTVTEEDKDEDDVAPSQPAPKANPSTAIPEIEGIDVTTIPIQVSGSYYNVRNYIRYLDEVGMIEPSSVVLTSEGRKVSSSVVLNVFHGEVD